MNCSTVHAWDGLVGIEIPALRRIDRRTYRPSPESNVPTPHVSTVVGALLADRREQVSALARSQAGIERLEVSGPGIVVEIRSVEVEHVRQVPSSAAAEPPPGRSRPSGRVISFTRTWPPGAVELRHLPHHRLPFGVDAGAGVKPNRDVRDATQLSAARAIARAGGFGAAEPHPARTMQAIMRPTTARSGTDHLRCAPRRIYQLADSRSDPTPTRFR